jgi:hypothetical protein
VRSAFIRANYGWNLCEGNHDNPNRPGSVSLYGEDGNDALNSQDGISGNDSPNGGAGTDTKVTHPTENAIVGFP